jgi:hypothetical protein
LGRKSWPALRHHDTERPGQPGRSAFFQTLPLLNTTDEELAAVSNFRFAGVHYSSTTLINNFVRGQFVKPRSEPHHDVQLLRASAPVSMEFPVKLNDPADIPGIRYMMRKEYRASSSGPASDLRQFNAVRTSQNFVWQHFVWHWISFHHASVHVPVDRG